MVQTTAVQVQLACALPVGSKLGPQEVITARGSVKKTNKQKTFVKRMSGSMNQNNESNIET